jgi:tRNA threonylcarbamoyladenosine biosynthesis protein TsaB
VPQTVVTGRIRAADPAVQTFFPARQVHNQAAGPVRGRGSDLRVPMKLLAVEQSSAACGAVLLLDDRAAACAAWRAADSPRAGLAAVLPRLLREAGMELAGVDAFAVGIGPGSFGGLRSACAALSAMALPDGKPVCGVCGARALAERLSAERGGRAAAVLGDARRGRLWLVRSGGGADPAAEASVELVAPDDVAGALPPGALIATPDWDRIGALLRERLRDAAECIEGPVCPTAEDVARRALELMRHGPPPAARPIYLHPPVARPAAAGSATVSTARSSS